jgi:hypothetical protein
MGSGEIWIVSDQGGVAREANLGGHSVQHVAQSARDAGANQAELVGGAIDPFQTSDSEELIGRDVCR